MVPAGSKQAGHLTLYFSAGDSAGAWHHMVDAIDGQPDLFHGEHGQRLDPAALRQAQPQADAPMPLAQLLGQQPRAALMPRLSGQLDDAGSRWERAQALLAAGVDVFASVDVTELASAARTCEALTGRRIPATVSDAVLYRADDIVWVDRRHGRRDSTSSALRTLALRILAVAERDDEAPTGAA